MKKLKPTIIIVNAILAIPIDFLLFFVWQDVTFNDDFNEWNLSCALDLIQPMGYCNSKMSFFSENFVSIFRSFFLLVLVGLVIWLPTFGLLFYKSKRKKK